MLQAKAGGKGGPAEHRDLCNSSHEGPQKVPENKSAYLALQLRPLPGAPQVLVLQAKASTAEAAAPNTETVASAAMSAVTRAAPHYIAFAAASS